MLCDYYDLLICNKLPPLSVASQLNTLTPVGTAIIIVAEVFSWLATLNGGNLLHEPALY